MTEHTSDIEYDLPPRSVARRRLVFAAVALLVVLVLVVTPPLLNVNRLRHRIATSMSESLGRPVHLDSVTLHLLPMPGFTLNNLVVSEDPAFGSEPVIRANQVEARLRFSSLWRRQVEFSTIRFIESDGNHPSLNIVRNAQGRWNLEDILMQAAHANTAPTAQRKAGSVPRFPYIEATSARVNIKLGEEKMPFSLTDTDFALWLSSPQQWSVRLQGTPARTDTNASDTGEMRLEGTLERAARFADVPLKLTASWAHAQMGEASLLIAGHDAGWRGTMEMGATLTGRLGAANLTTDVHLTDLRRADFVPAKQLDVSAHCTAQAEVVTITLMQATCTLPTSGPQPIVLTSPLIDLQRPDEAAGSLEINAVPLAWALDWAKLFSQRISPELQPDGRIDGQIQRVAGQSSTSLLGNLRATLLPAAPSNSSARTIVPPAPTVFNGQVALPAVSVRGNPSANLQLQPTVLRLGTASQVTLSGDVDPAGYVLHLSGNASLAQVKTLAGFLPPLGDGLEEALPGKAAPETLRELSVSCSRLWDGMQKCVSTAADVPLKKKRSGKRR
ncbi:AsmA family protein [Granulicella mallensis]|uniref:AsmA family protein n=1 Tax=Granulicella mallensis (strain ATCC BAA-1857 / DSM 23137 / MP5ACTX8) TaxID=682795 RepID=G8P0R5_GRAMM|nr:AsmA family protein [Granulicella mallensis]AEU34673.1 AsmA family protein [Granulicella mallensis MP5ACTX8]